MKPTYDEYMAELAKELFPFGSLSEQVRLESQQRQQAVHATGDAEARLERMTRTRE